MKAVEHQRQMREQAAYFKRIIESKDRIISNLEAEVDFLKPELENLQQAYRDACEETEEARQAYREACLEGEDRYNTHNMVRT